MSKIKCTKVRKCGWKGDNSELIEKVDKKESKECGFEVRVHVCPKCGHDEYYADE